MRKYLSPLFVGLLTLTLSSCAVLSNNTGCKKIGGMTGCVSLSEVNRLSETGGLPDQKTPAITKTQPIQALGYTAVTPEIGQPVRQGDHIQQITIFPFEDQAGNYHEASIVYTVLQSSHWVGHPVTAIQDQEL